MEFQETTTDLRSKMETIDPYEFEEFVADLWQAEGWQTAVSQASGDMGIDVVAEKSGSIDQQLVIQAKRYQRGNKVGRPDVQQYHSLKDQEVNADAVVVVTTSGFTKDARLWAHDHNVKLVDGDDLADMVRRQNAEELVEEYAEGVEQTETSTTQNRATSDSRSSSSGSDGSPSFDGISVESKWFRSVAIGTGISLFGFAVMFEAFTPGIQAISDAAVIGGFFAWMGLPVVMFLDAVAAHGNEADWKPNRVVWPAVTFLTGGLAGVWYLGRRLLNS